MKKIICGALCLASTAHAGDMPKVYGKVNVEYTTVSQDDKFGYRQTPTVMNVGNSESRLGVKGKYELDKVKASYQLELGLDSTYNDSKYNNSGSSSFGKTSGRVRIRQANANVGTGIGSFTLGQTYTPTAKLVLALDPLSDTSVGAQALSQNRIVKNIDKNLGYHYRSRKDLFMYSTKKMKGFKWQISVDRDDKNEIDRTVENGKTYYENLVSYENKLGNTDFEFHVGHVKWSGLTSNDEQLLMAGTKVGFENGLGFSFIYSAETEKDVSTPANTIDKNRIFGAATYKFGKNKVALTYANYDYEKTGAATDHSENQIALGLKHKLSKEVQLKLVAAKLERTEDKVANQANENDATLVAFGTQIKF